MKELKDILNESIFDDEDTQMDRLDDVIKFGNLFEIYWYDMTDDRTFTYMFKPSVIKKAAHELGYFKDNKLTAYNEKGEESMYWLRTPYSGWDQMYVVGHGGLIGGFQVGDMRNLGWDVTIGIRPVLNISKDTEIELVEGVFKIKEGL